MNLIQRQILIEKLSDSQAQAAKLAVLNEQAAKGYDHLPHAQTVMRNHIFNMVDVLASIPLAPFNRYYFSFIDNVGLLECSYIGISTLIESTTKKKTNADRLMRGIGKNIFARSNPPADLNLTAVDYIHIGKFVAESMYRVGLLERYKSNYMLGAELIEYLSKYDQSDVNSVFSVEYTSMICQPKPWTNSFDGGYLTQSRRMNNPLISLRNHSKANKDYYAGHTATSMPLVFKAVNYFQSQSFSIDESIPLHENKLIKSIQGINGTDDFYIPTFLDSRGRVYYRSSLSPQGDAHTRIMLNFGHDKTEELTERGKYWLRVAMANAVGFDKARLDVRANHRLTGNESPEDMIAYTKYKKELDKGYTNCMVQVDATCSGLGILSALTADEVGGYHTNLIDDGSEFKHDIYQAVSDMANSTYVIPYPTTRDRVKRIVMCSVYSLSSLGAMRYTREAFLKDGIVLSHKESSLIAKCIVMSLQDIVPKAYALMDWLKKNVMNEWTSPSGFRARQDYRIMKKKYVMVGMAGIKRATFHIHTGKINSRKMKSAFVPNFIHSLDAAHLVMVTNRCADENIPLAVIHDAYLTHPNYMDRLNVILRETYVEMIMSARKLIDVPTGSLEIHSVLNSEFIFS